MSGELLDDKIAAPLNQLVARDIPSLCRKVVLQSADSLDDVEEVLPCMERADDLDSVRDKVLGEVPYARRSVSEDAPSLGAEEFASLDLVQNPADNGGELSVRVACGDRFDRDIMADG